MLNAQLAELEQEFRKQWRGYQPQSYSNYLEQVPPEEEAALLARLLSVELEYAYQPPNLLDEFESDASEKSSSTENASEDEDDQRVFPRVTLFFHRFPQLKTQRELLIQLVMLEFALRLRFDAEPPNYDSYLDLCPNEKERVGGMMQMMEEKLQRAGRVRSSTAEPDQHDTTVPEGAAPKTISLSQLPCSLGYFLLTDVIGKGGMGTVYNAIDLRSAAHVAVKIIHRSDSWSVYRFIEEFTWLSTLNHPNVVKLYDTFSEGDLRYFSMEVVEGQPIRQWFSELPSGERWNALRRALSQAALAIAFLHDHEVIHRDIKSSNLMITGRGRAVLLDLGLASRVSDEQIDTVPLDGTQVVGTLHYLSPESLNGSPPSFAGDWYSFGVTIYETVSGTFPPITVDLTLSKESGKRYQLNGDVVNKQLELCPQDLRELCLQLLNPDPSARPTASEIIRRLGSDVGRPIPFEVLDSDFVGRESGLAFLENGLQKVQQGQASLRLIRGDSGMGKTALVNRWSREKLIAQNFLWLGIRCHCHDHNPLRALNLIVQELVTCLSKRPIDLWLDLSKGGGEEIVYTFPQMERLHGASWPEISRTADSMEGVARRTAGLHALHGWLKGLSERIPLVIAIDDAHWADSESGKFLSHLLSGSDSFRCMMIVVDQGAGVPSPFLHSLVESHPEWMHSDSTYEIPPLTRDECTRLLKCWSDRLMITLGHEVLDDILNRSGGSPFLLQELLRSYVNYIIRHRLSDEPWLSSGPSEAGVLNNRFSMLPPTTEKVLQFLAVSTQPLGIHQLQTVTRILPGPLLAELNHLSGQGWIRWNGRAVDSEVEISHERFREVVLQSMMEDRLQRRHYRMARMLSSEVPPPWRRIAHHYSEAKQYREAAACYMEGARAAARRLSFAEALWLLERAFHPLAQRTEREQQIALRLRADCLAGQGNSVAAAEAYDDLASGESNDSLLMQCLSGEQWIRAGRLNEGLGKLRAVLRQLGVLAEDKGSIYHAISALKTYWLRLQAPSLSILETNEQPFSEIEQCLNRISGPLVFLDSKLGSKLVERMFRLAMQHGTNFDRAIAIMRWSLILSQDEASARRRAIGWIWHARRLARNSGSENARALSHVCMFLWHSLQGRFDTSLRYARRAQRLYEAHYASDTWETGFVCWISLSHLWYLGQLKELCDRTASYRKDASQRDDAMWTFWMHVNAGHLSDLIQDDVEQGRRSIDIASRSLTDNGFQIPQYVVWISRIRQLLYEDRALEARELLIAKWSDVLAKGIHRLAYYNWLSHYMRVICNLACLNVDPSRKSKYIRDARGSLRTLSSLEQTTFVTYANSLQLVLDAAEGKTAPAEQWQQAQEIARESQLTLLAQALAWHRQTWFPQSDDADPQQTWKAEGCVRPERLINVVLPLPVPSGRSTANPGG